MYPEFDLLLCCARTHQDQATIVRLKALLATPTIDFERLISLAGAHRVRPLLFHSLMKHKSDILSEPAFQRLQGYCRQATLRNMFLMNELLDIAEFLERNGVTAVTFKGPVLATIYGNLSLRQISDVDLLVPESDFQKAVDLLVTNGYEQSVQVPWETHLTSPISSLTGPYSIDLHRVIVPKHLSCFVEASELWNTVESFTYLDRRVLTFSPEMELFILCLNGTKEGWRRLNRVCDVAELLRAHPSLDWQQVFHKAEQWGMQRLLSLGLLLASDLVEAPLPTSVRHEIQSDHRVKSIFSEVSHQLIHAEAREEPGEVERTLFHIRLRERWPDKVRSLIGLMSHSGWLEITENDRDFLHLPEYLSFLYYFIRPARVLTKYAPSLKS